MELTKLLKQGATREGDAVILSVQNPHSSEYLRYVVTLIKDGQKYLCGHKGVYKSRVTAQAIFDSMVKGG